MADVKTRRTVCPDQMLYGSGPCGSPTVDGSAFECTLFSNDEESSAPAHDGLPADVEECVTARVLERHHFFGAAVGASNEFRTVELGIQESHWKNGIRGREIAYGKGEYVNRRRR